MTDLLSFWLLDVSIKGSVVVAIVALLLAVAGRRLTPAVRHLLWLVVLVRFALPAVPESPLSLFNLLPADAPPGAIAVATVPATATISIDASMVAASGSPLIPRGAVAIVWLIGMVVTGGVIAYRSLVLQRAVRRARRRHGSRNELLERLSAEAALRAGVMRRVEVVVTDIVASPALHGFVRPVILVPGSSLRTLTEGELRQVLLHEMWHVRRHDVAVSWFLAAVRIVHWFNPLVWLAVRAARDERELACDAKTLATLDASDREGYGRTILKIIASGVTGPRLAAPVGMVNSLQTMKRRLEMIASYRMRKHAPIAALAIVALVATVALTDAVAGDVKKKMVHKHGSHGEMMLMERVSTNLTQASLSDLLTTLSAQSGRVIRQSDELRTHAIQNTRFSVDATAMPLEVVLRETLKPAGAKAKLDGDVVMIVPYDGSDHHHHGENVIVEKSSGDDVEVTEDVIVKREGDKVTKKVIRKGGDAAASSDATMERKVKIEKHVDGPMTAGKRTIELKLDENGVVSTGSMTVEVHLPESASK